MTLFKRRQQRETAITMVSDEIHHNADQIDYGLPHHEQFIAFSFDSWHKHRHDVNAHLGRRHRELFETLVSLYDALSRMRRHNEPAPHSLQLRAAADALRATIR